MRMLRSAERPAERGGEGGDLSKRKAWAGTRAATGNSWIAATLRECGTGT